MPNAVDSNPFEGTVYSARFGMNLSSGIRDPHMAREMHGDLARQKRKDEDSGKLEYFSRGMGHGGQNSKYQCQWQQEISPAAKALQSKFRPASMASDFTRIAAGGPRSALCSVFPNISIGSTSVFANPMYLFLFQFLSLVLSSTPRHVSTNGSPHNALTSNAFPDNALTNVSPNIVQQIVQPVHSSHAGFHAKAVTRPWQLVGRPRFEAVFGMSRQSC